MKLLKQGEYGVKRSSSEYNVGIPSHTYTESGKVSSCCSNSAVHVLQITGNKDVAT